MSADQGNGTSDSFSALDVKFIARLPFFTIQDFRLFLNIPTNKPRKSAKSSTLVQLASSNSTAMASRSQTPANKWTRVTSKRECAIRRRILISYRQIKGLFYPNMWRKHSILLAELFYKLL